MCIQVVHDKYDFVAVRIAHIHQIPDFLSSFNCGAMLPDTYMPHAAQGFYKYKYPTGAIAHIFVINLVGIPGAHGQWFPGFPQQQVWLFVHAYYQYSRVIGNFIDVQDILHAGYEFCIFVGRDAPIGIVVRSKFIF